MKTCSGHNWPDAHSVAQVDGKAMFDALDSSRSGYLEYDQLPALFKQLERRVRDDEIRALATLIHLYDSRNEGKVRGIG